MKTVEFLFLINNCLPSNKTYFIKIPKNIEILIMITEYVKSFSD